MDTLNMDEVVTILRERGIAAYVEQTGGGTATIMAGTVDPEGRCEAQAGPGWFDGPGWTNAKGDTDDFAVGPDDDGESDPVFADATWTEQTVADAIVDAIR